MDKFVIASMRKSAGKTSTIIGIGKALNKKFSYIKPFGERLLYRKKRLWDYDAALITSIFDLKERPEDMSIGFHHSKLLFMLNENTTKEKLSDLLARVGNDNDIVFIEAGRDFSYGVSVYLDAFSLAEYFGAYLLFIISGDEDNILDDVTFLKKRINMKHICFHGVIINKVHNIDDFNDTHLPIIKKLGIKVLGIIPYYDELNFFSVGYLADQLFGKTITVEANIEKTIKNIFIGSMSASTAQKNPLFHEENNLVITSGDQTDMIMASLDSKASAIILANNILPASNLIIKAEQLGIPLLIVSSNIYETAKKIYDLEPLPTKDDTEKIALIEGMIRTYVNVKELLPA